MGPHTIDRFASYYNSQLPRFNSRFGNPGTEAVDAFTTNWSGENNWLCPPIVLIPRVIANVKGCACKVTLITLAWQSAPYWLLLCPNGYEFVTFVKEGVVSIPLYEGLFTPGRSGAVLFNGGKPSTEMFAMQLDFTHTSR